jgi:hypothetical protein
MTEKRILARVVDGEVVSENEEDQEILDDILERIRSGKLAARSFQSGVAHLGEAHGPVFVEPTKESDND